MTTAPERPAVSNPLLDLLRTAATERPDEVAIVEGSIRWTWGRLAGRADAAAALLSRCGVRDGDRVLLIDKNGPAHLVALFASGLLRAVFVPVNWRLATPELRALVADADCPVVIAGPDEAGRIAEVAVAAARSCRTITTAELLAAPAAGQAPEPGEPGDVLAQLYTSGTTGVPKGALFGAANLRVLMTDVGRAWDLGPADVSLGAMPLFHMGGLAWAIASLARGARLVLMRDFAPQAVLDADRDEGVTAAFFVPAMIAALLDTLESSGQRLGLRRMTYSGSPMPPALLARARRLLQADLCQIYGLTEATGAFAQLEPADHVGDRSRSVGKPYPWAEVAVVDPVTAAPVGPGAEGEIWTRSAQNFLGYHRQPEETPAALTPDGWLRTGDVGLIDGDGYIWLLDRRKDMIISGGENVYPAEVEKVLAAYEPVLEAAVIGVPSPRWGETVKAVVVPRPGAVVNEADLIAFTRKQLAAFKCPTSVDIVQALPRTATGKIRKDIVRAPYWAGRDRPIG
jgi:long-chain acyl-CoA synthetase